MTKKEVSLKERMESINNSINGMVDTMIQDAMKNFKFGKFDMMDPEMCMYVAKAVNLAKDSMKLSVEMCEELDYIRDSMDVIKEQNNLLVEMIDDLRKEIKK